MDLQDKVVIVTGASPGIGRQIAIEFGRRGARVVLAARTVEPRRTLPGTLGETVQIIADAGGEAIAVQCDVAEPADLERLVATAVDTFGGLDVVVNNAADMIGGDFETLIEAILGKPAVPTDEGTPAPGPFDNWFRQFAINVHGPYLLMTLATPHLRANGGVIVNITSGAAEPIDLEAALQNPPANPSLGYAVTKAALNRLTNAAAAKLAGHRIAVVAVDPGVVQTEVRDLLDENGITVPLHTAPMSVAVAAVLDIVTSDDPMAYSGQIIRAQPGTLPTGTLPQ